MKDKEIKTIFLVVDLGISIRNILRTDVFKILKKQEGLRIVIFSPITDEEFVSEFDAENVVIEPLPEWKPIQLFKPIHSLKKDLWAERENIFTFKNRRKKKNRKFYRIILRMLEIFNSENGLEKFLRYLDKIEADLTPMLESRLFDKYQPSLVFYSSLYTKYLSILIGAHQRKIKTMSFIQSWDNPTSKGPFRVTPDKIIVWNNILKEEVAKFHYVSPQDILLSGVPQFDLYLDKEHFLSKEIFFQELNLDADKKLITYTTGPHNMLPDEHEVVDLLYASIQADKTTYPSQLLVRLHPKDDMKYYKKFENMPGLVLQLPGQIARTNDRWNPTQRDMYGLAELMFYSDVVVNTSSTITIDAACLDTPVVNIAFDGYREKPYMDSCKRYYDYDHYKNILATKGVRKASSIDEAIDCINSYLMSPDLDREGRKKIVEDQCWKFDGRSGQRIAEHILSFLNEHLP